MKAACRTRGYPAALLAVCLLAPGCANEEVVRAREQAAFYAGQAQALAQKQARTVTIVGDVAKPTIEFREGLTLAQALVQAEPQARRDPRSIVLRRREQAWQFDTRKFLRGELEDPVLEPGDIIELRP